MELTSFYKAAPVPVLTPQRAANSVLRAHWDGALPVRPERIADGLRVQLIPRGGPNDLGYEFSGYFSMRADKPVVEYNMSDPLVRQRFTIAHELGHFVLGHKDAPRDPPSSFGTGVMDPQERAANQFAAELLMPADSVRTVVRSGKLASLDEIAKAFAVSKVAMGYRLTNLEIFL